MGERYWITGVQLGLFKYAIDPKVKAKDRKELSESVLKEIYKTITDEQFISNFELEEDKKRFIKHIKEIQRKENLNG